MPQFSTPNINFIPKDAELHSVDQERLVRVIVPPNTNTSTGKRAAENGVKRWIERLSSENLVLTSDVEIEGPFFCPFLDHYGEDMWLGRAKFSSIRPRLVPAEQIQAARRLSEQAGMSYEQWRSANVPALPADFRSQLQFVKDNPDKVLADIQEVEKMKNG